MWIAGQPPRRAAPDAGNRHIGVLTHEGMPLVVIARPDIEIILQAAHERNRIDSAGPMRERRMCDGALHRNAQPRSRPYWR